MATIEVTSREFREKQKAIFDKADNGEKIIIKRGKKQAYVLTPISVDDLYFSPEMLAKIEASKKEVEKGEITKISSKEKLQEYLDSL
jgi:PHD/YefM family antitoxin component YafN of YafNO toxin-antitoxin module